MRFYFNLTGATYDRDNEGTELPNISAARTQAVQFASEVLRDEPSRVWTGEEVRVEVTDDTRLLLFTVIAFAVDAPAAKGRT